MKYILIALITYSSLVVAGLPDEQTDFFKSFVRNYGLSDQARDTREYHPYLLSRAQESMNHMERSFVDAGFLLADRIIVMGYQHDAIPSYYCSSEKQCIDDEQSIKQSAGWVHATGNIFGFITGYILKNVSGVIEHIVPQTVGLLDARATLFTKHAFGAAYHNAVAMQSLVTKAIMQKQTNAVLAALLAFWNYLYVQQPRTGHAQLIATQDILFSLAHLQSINRSSVPIRKWFVGPDITYPIVAKQHAVDATQGAQQCVAKVHEQLQPINNQKTAYIVCSFVDGVGKSTLCANLLQYKQFGNCFEQYQAVDNSSSLQAAYYEYQDNVLLVDLPAQMSHYTIKPEGKVYVSVAWVSDTVQIDLDIIKQAFVYRTQAPFESTSPEYQYGQLCSLLSVQEPFIPFNYNGHHLLLNPDDDNDMHLLVDLNQVCSKGLKVKHPERMLFSGVSFAQSAQSLTQELIQQLHALNVTHIVFIDCMGMYPRSSRENIRLNFLLQQLMTQFGTAFTMHPCFYKGMVNPQELYAVMAAHADELSSSICKESIMRYFFQLLMDNYSGHQTTLDTKHIQQLLHHYLPALYEQYEQPVTTLVQEKMIDEFQEIKQQYQYDRIFQSIVLFDWHAVRALSNYIEQLFSTTILSEYHNGLWSCMREIEHYAHDAYYQDKDAQLFITPSGYCGKIVAIVADECKDQTILAPVINRIRAQWYATLSNLAGCEYDELQDTLISKQIVVGVAPLLVTQASDGAWLLIERYDTQLSSITMSNAHKLFLSAAKDEQPKKINGYYYQDVFTAVDWGALTTHERVYGYGLCQSKSVENNALAAIVRRCVQDSHEQLDADRVIPTSQLAQELLKKRFVEYAQRLADAPHIISSSTALCQNALQAMVRAYATVDAILKDPQSPIMICNQHDLGAAAYLFEHITLPAYFSISLAKPLFDQYKDITPVVPI